MYKVDDFKGAVIDLLNTIWFFISYPLIYFSNHNGERSSDHYGFGFVVAFLLGSIDLLVMLVIALVFALI